MANKSSILARFALAGLGLAVVIPSLLPQGVSAATVASAYKRVGYNGYSFEVPSGWKASAHMDGVTNMVSFRDAKQKEVGDLMCLQRPLPIEGAYLQDESSRHLIKNGFLYRVYLNILTDTQGNDSFAIIDMDHVGYRSSALGDSDPGYGCRLHVTTPDYAAVARRVYKSVRIEDWKTLTGAGVTMKYPAAWNLGTSQQSGNGTVRNLTDINGRVIATSYCGPASYGATTADLRPPVTASRSIRNKFGSFTAIWKQVRFNSDPQSISWTKDGAPAYSKDTTECNLTTNFDGQDGFLREMLKSLK